MQSIEFTGFLVADPTAKSIPSGTSLTTFTVGVTRAYKNANGDKVSDFFRVNAWGLGVCDSLDTTLFVRRQEVYQQRIPS